MEGTKACSKCGKAKPLSDFRLSKDCLYGRRPNCRTCEAKYYRQYRKSGAQAKARRANPVSCQLSQMLARSRRSAKKKGIEHNIDVKYLHSIVPSHCPYLGMELRWEVQAGLGIAPKPFPNSPSLDRIDSSKGYIKGNVVIVSHRANAIKNNATEQELFRIGRAVSLLKAELAFPD